MDFPWTLGLSVAAVALTAAALGGGPLATVAAWLLATTEGLERAEIWRLWTGPLVHGNTAHLVRDVSVFLLLGVVYERELGKRYLVMMTAGLALPALLVLLVQPELGAYLGLSGLVNVQLAACFIHELKDSGRRPTWWILFLTVAYGLKLVFETASGGLMMDMDLGDGVVAAPLAHLSGALLGTLIVLWPKRRWLWPAAVRQ
jgi:rhomboid family GlyGly-CTERM serine protease